MIEAISYVFIYLAEGFIAVLYFENKYERRISFNYLIIATISISSILYLGNYVGNMYVNLALFFIMNYTI